LFKNQERKSMGGAAAAAAAAKRRQEQQEEEEMTKYTDEDLREGWEFKIVRSNTNAFRNPATLQKLVEDEALAGWMMLEKFDEGRVRFKRPVSARTKDSSLPDGVDPYRATYGISEGKLAMIITAAILALVVAISGVVVLLSSSAAR
jgi:hypothetical protein